MSKRSLCILEAIRSLSKWDSLTPDVVVVGNVSDLPVRGMREWEHWLKLKDVYGLCHIIQYTEEQMYRDDCPRRTY
jgi:predicted alpha/beta hydrolase